MCWRPCMCWRTASAQRTARTGRRRSRGRSRPVCVGVTAPCRLVREGTGGTACGHSQYRRSFACRVCRRQCCKLQTPHEVWQWVCGIDRRATRTRAGTTIMMADPHGWLMSWPGPGSLRTSSCRCPIARSDRLGIGSRRVATARDRSSAVLGRAPAAGGHTAACGHDRVSRRHPLRSGCGGVPGVPAVVWRAPCSRRPP
jgi:hypothetical protein